MNLPDFLSKDKYGFIHLTGHRVGLIHIIDRYNDGNSADVLQELLPTVELPLIHKVLAFYLENRSEVDTYIARCHAEIDKQAQGPRRGPDHAELRRRMEAKQQSESERKVKFPLSIGDCLREGNYDAAQLHYRWLIHDIVTSKPAAEIK